MKHYTKSLSVSPSKHSPLGIRKVVVAVRLDKDTNE